MHLSGSVKGWDPVAFEFVSGVAVGQVLSSFCNETFCFGGLYNGVGTGHFRNTLIQEQFPCCAPGGPRVRFVATETTVPVANDGSSDFGVVSGVAGDPQFQLVFRRIGTGASTFLIGAHEDYFEGSSGSGGWIDTVNTRVSVAAFRERLSLARAPPSL